MNELKLAVIQSFLHWGDKEKNLKSFSAKLEQVGEVDIIVLPETFSTGFCMKQAAQYAESSDGKTMEWLANQAQKYDAVITGSHMVEDNGNYYNRLIWMRPDGTFESYDKRHLFRLAYEQNYFTAGENKKIVTLKGWNINLNICYDLRFPVWCRNIDNEYDLLLFVANWPKKRIDHWKQLLKARAIENLSYVVGCNRIGMDGTQTDHCGNSSIISPMGIVLKQSIKEEIIHITLEKKILESVRNRLQFYKDADQFEIKT